MSRTLMGLALLAGWGPPPAAGAVGNSAAAAAPGAWSPTGPMATGRTGHTATRLSDGRVLMVGSSTVDNAPLASAELYDPVAGTWRATGGLAAPRGGHTATLLADGSVLVAGGSGLAGAERYDPASGAWRSAGAMGVARSGHSTTLLPNGSVLVAGGCGGCARGPGNTQLASTELYDPAGNSSRATGAMAVGHNAHTATLLVASAVLVAGGGHYETPAVNAAVRLADGTLLAVAGNPGGCCAGLASAERYNPATGAWSPAGSLAQGRYGHTATLLPDGTALIAGGCSCCSTPTPVLVSSERYDPGTGAWSGAGTMGVARYGHAAVTLAGGSVLVAGGSAGSSSAAVTASAERFVLQPAGGITTLALSSTAGGSASASPAGPTYTAGAALTLTATAAAGSTFTGWTVDGAPAGSANPYVLSMGADHTVVAVFSGASAAGFAVALSPASLAFGNQAVGTASAAKAVAVTNTGGAPLAISGVALGGANPGQFARTHTCPVAPATLGAGASCTISVTFKPSSSGAKTAAVSVASNAPGGPHQVALSGTGGAPKASLSPNSLSFADRRVGTTSAPKTVTLTNAGTAPMAVAGIAASGDFRQTNNCPANLARGASCAIGVTVTPLARGDRLGALTVTDDALGSPRTVDLDVWAY